MAIKLRLGPEIDPSLPVSELATRKLAVAVSAICVAHDDVSALSSLCRVVPLFICITVRISGVDGRIMHYNS
jgi:hypothetical protein